MPNYGFRKYGTFRYGKYVINKNTDYTKKEFKFLRVGKIYKDKTSVKLRTLKEPITFSGKNKVRIRSNISEWVILNKEVVKGEVFKVRVRTINKDKKSKWLVSERRKLI